jgi:hypothetical protein
MTGVLDGERKLVQPTAETTQKFIVQDDVEKAFASSSLKKLNGEEKWKTLFSKLAPHFEAGFLLINDQNSWITADTFIFGKKFSPPKNQPIYFGHRLPQVRVGQMARARGPAVLQTYHLDGIVELKESSAFLIRVSPQIAFLLICNRPNPWQQLFMEKFFDLYMKFQ